MRGTVVMGMPSWTVHSSFGDQSPSRSQPRRACGSVARHDHLDAAGRARAHAPVRGGRPPAEQRVRPGGQNGSHEGAGPGAEAARGVSTRRPRRRAAASPAAADRSRRVRLPPPPAPSAPPSRTAQRRGRRSPRRSRAPRAPGGPPRLAETNVFHLCDEECRSRRAHAQGDVAGVTCGHASVKSPCRVSTLMRPMSSFADLGLSEPALEALAHLGYERPTPIQEQAIPPLLEGRDVIGQAQTGTGKTAAFGLPMVEYVDPAALEIQALVLTPTRELCIQVTQALRAYGERSGHRRGGGVRRRPDPRPGHAAQGGARGGGHGRPRDGHDRPPPPVPRRRSLRGARRGRRDARPRLPRGRGGRSCAAPRWAARPRCSAPPSRPRSAGWPSSSCTTRWRSRCAPPRSRSTPSTTTTSRCPTARSPRRW